MYGVVEHLHDHSVLHTEMTMLWDYCKFFKTVIAVDGIPAEFTHSIIAGTAFWPSLQGKQGDYLVKSPSVGLRRWTDFHKGRRCENRDIVC